MDRSEMEQRMDAHCEKIKAYYEKMDTYYEKMDAVSKGWWPR
jgi:uncharacterized coiled-coil DUF342 family protein